MIVDMSKVRSSLELYRMQFFVYQPKKAESLEFRVHDLVGSILEFQVNQIINLEDLISAKDCIDKFIRSLKAEFDLVSVKIDEFSYPRFLNRIMGIKVDNKYLQAFHHSVVTLLKVLLFRILNSNDQKTAEIKLEKFTKSSLPEIFDYSRKRLFFDSSTNQDVFDIEEIINRQLDISSDNTF